MEYLEYSTRLKKDKITFHVAWRDNNMCLHTHEFLELAYVSQGTIEHILNGRKEYLQKGDYIIVDYGAEHGYRQIGEDPICVINCLFLPEFIDKVLIHCHSFQEVIQHYLIHMGGPYTILKPNSLVFHDNDGRIAKLIANMQDEYANKKAGYLEFLRSNLIELMILTMRKIDLPSVQLDRVCDNIIRYVNENYAKPLSLSQLSEEMNYSLPYLSRRFKEETGMTFCNYVQKVRVEQSCRLLANTEKSVIEIAQLVGYSDIKFFNHLFKQQKNMSPRIFRKFLQEENA